MATSSMVPYSNPAGNNQTKPSIGVLTSGAGAIGAGGKAGGALPVVSPVAPVGSTGTTNPFMPAPIVGTTPGVPTGPVPMGAGGPSAPTITSSFITPNSSYSSGENDLQKQLIDIYGKGVGGSLFQLLNSASGTNSTILQQYIASLQPQFAKSQADLGASLGAGGVSPNSSVAALGEANLKAQEDALISGESAKLTTAQEDLTASLLGGMSGAAAKEVASSGWDVFAQIMEGVGNVAGTAIGDRQAGTQIWGGMADNPSTTGAQSQIF